jgi:hypothetical protein
MLAVLVWSVCHWWESSAAATFPKGEVLVWISAEGESFAGCGLECWGDPAMPPLRSISSCVEKRSIKNLGQILT